MDYKVVIESMVSHQYSTVVVKYQGYIQAGRKRWYFRITDLKKIKGLPPAGLLSKYEDIWVVGREIAKKAGHPGLGYGISDLIAANLNGSFTNEDIEKLARGKRLQEVIRGPGVKTGNVNGLVDNVKIFTRGKL